MVIIGIVGSTCAGKSTFSNILKEKFNYKIIKLEDDDQLNGQLFTEALYQWTLPTVIYPFKKKEHLEKLQKRSYFHIIWLDAPVVVRYKRYQKKYGGNISFEDFVKMDDETKFQNRMIECIQKCKIRLFNQSNQIEDLQNQIIQQREKIDRPFRPNWEVYFMKVAYVLKSRSNCMKKSVGAVLVDKYKRIISTSYNGTPKVMTNCNEGGCQVCNEDHSLKLILYKCWCIHAEEGCILEAGVAQSRGATLYTTLFPCVWCCKALCQAGVEAIYYDEKGDWELSLQFLGDQLTLKQIQISNYIF